MNSNIVDSIINQASNMRLLAKDEIKVGTPVYIRGDDTKLYPLTIVSDNSYSDEDKQLAISEAYYYQERDELFYRQASKKASDFIPPMKRTQYNQMSSSIHEDCWVMKDTLIEEYKVNPTLAQNFANEVYDFADKKLLELFKSI